MKKCPYCAEEILEEAIKCKHCQEFLEKPKASPWYYSTSSWVVAVLVVGPLALPLVWMNPKYSILKKTLITTFVLILTFILGKLFVSSLQSLQKYYEMLV